MTRLRRCKTMAESRNKSPNYNPTNSAIRRADYHHFVAMREGSTVLANRINAAGGHG